MSSKGHNSCPWCGGTEIELQTGTEDREGTPVNAICVKCGAAGPWQYLRAKDPIGEKEALAYRLWDYRN